MSSSAEVPLRWCVTAANFSHKDLGMKAVSQCSNPRTLGGSLVQGVFVHVRLVGFEGMELQNFLPFLPLLTLQILQAS